MYKALHWRDSLAIGLLLGCSVTALGQKQEAAAPEEGSGTASPLAAAATSAKAQKTAHAAKKVFTDDDMEANAGPLPRLKMDGPDNGEEIVAAIAKYKETHTQEQTEQIVQTWYDRYDQMLVATIQENRDMQMIGSVNMSNGNELCEQSQDYEHCQSRQRADQRGSRTDQTQMMKNNALMMRIQRVFQRVKASLMMYNMHYAWFRIQTNSYNGDEM